MMKGAALMSAKFYSTLSINEAAFHEDFLDAPCDLRPAGQRIACCFPMTAKLAKSLAAWRDPETVINLGQYLFRLDNLKKRIFAEKMGNAKNFKEI
jgi:hypothetical protein